MAPSSPPLNPRLAAALAPLAELEDAPAAAGVSAPSSREDEDEGRRLLRRAISQREAARRAQMVDSLHL